MFLEISQNSQENPCARLSFLIKLQASACSFIIRETQAQVFSLDFCEISKNTFFTEYLWTTTPKNIHGLTENNQGVGHISIFVVSALKMSVCGTIANYFLKFRKVIKCHRKSSKFVNYHLLRNSISCPATSHVCRWFHK